MSRLFKGQAGLKMNRLWTRNH